MNHSDVIEEVISSEYPDKLVIMVSGGIDSITTSYLLRKKCDHVRGITLNYGQLDFKRARQCVNRMSVALEMPVEVVDMRTVAESFAGFIEKDYGGYPLLLTELSRGSAMSTALCSVYAEKIGYRGIVDCVIKDDLQRYTYRTQVHKHIAATQSFGNPFEFQVVTPLLSLTKVEVLRLAQQLGVPLADTWSCWEGFVKHCGNCPGCRSRREAFAKAEMDDPIIYQRPEEAEKIVVEA